MMENVSVLPAETSFEAFLSAEETTGRMCHAVVTHDGHIRGVLRVNMALRRGLAEDERGVTLGELASRDYTVVQEQIFRDFRNNMSGFQERTIAISL